MLIGSLRGIDAGRLSFAPDLEANLTKGDEGIRGFTRLVDEFIAQHGLTAPEDSPVGQTSVAPISSTAHLDLRAARQRRREEILTLGGKVGAVLRPMFPGLVDRMVRRAIERFYE